MSLPPRLCTLQYPIPSLLPSRQPPSTDFRNFDQFVQDGYKWLMDNYRDGDKIFLFGFSRGAYTARALAGMIQRVGERRGGSGAQLTTGRTAQPGQPQPSRSVGWLKTTRLTFNVTPLFLEDLSRLYGVRVRRRSADYAARTNYTPAKSSGKATTDSLRIRPSCIAASLAGLDR